MHEMLILMEQEFIGARYFMLYGSVASLKKVISHIFGRILLHGGCWHRSLGTRHV